MASNNICPECDSVLPPTAKSCPCGWEELETDRPKPRGKQKAIPDSKHLCSWRNGSERCPMPATVENENTGHRWVCHGHAYRPRDPVHNQSYFETIDRALNNRATQVHEMSQSMIRSASYWEKDGFHDVLKIDQVKLREFRARSPQWFKECSFKILEIVKAEREACYANQL